MTCARIDMCSNRRTTEMCRSAGARDRRRAYFHFLFFIGAFCITFSTTAWTDTPSFSEWHDTIEKAFKNFQAQEEKLLEVGSAKTLTWERGLRTSVKPEDNIIEAERKRDPHAVATLEACRNALMSGGVLLLQARGQLPPGRDNALNIDGDIPFDQYARRYIGFAETCEEGLHLSPPTNAFRARYR